MSQYFSFPRFWRLFRRHTAEHATGYAMAATVLGGLLLLLMGFTAYLSGGLIDVTWQTIFFVLFMLLGSTIFTSTVFAQFGDKRRATVALLLPASQLEKYLVAWLYSLPLFLLVYTAVFYLVDAAVLYAGAQPGAAPQFLNVFANGKAASGMFWRLAVLHGIWLWGAIHFEKEHFIKTSFAFLLAWAALCGVNYQAMRMLLNNAVLSFSPPFVQGLLNEDGRVYHLEVPEAYSTWFDLLPVALALLLWVAAYFRVTEKQL